MSGYFTVNIALSESWHEHPVDKQQLAALCGCCEGWSLRRRRGSRAEISAGLQPSLALGIKKCSKENSRSWSLSCLHLKELESLDG